MVAPWYLQSCVMTHRGFSGMVSMIFSFFGIGRAGGPAGLVACIASVLVGWFRVGFPSLGIWTGHVPSLVVMVQGMGLSQAFALFWISMIASFSVVWVLVIPRRLVV